jgi:hypothetical protein
MENTVKGTLSKILAGEAGTSKDGKGWKKITFTVANNDGYEGREMLYAFEIFGTEKVDNFIKYNKEGSAVEVMFNIQVNEWQGKYYTSLQAWKVMSVERVEQATATIEETDDLPF